jgi:hypothetical protein
MIDGFKILELSVNRELFLNNPLIEPHIPPTNKKTGEVKNEPEPAKYEGLKFLIYPNRIELNGSLHTFYNQGLHNYNDFHYRKLESVILELKHDLGIDPENSVLNNLEIGVNMELQFSPDRFLNNIIMHRGAPFTWQHQKTKRYRECSHTQFFIKSYNKGIQNRLKKSILRFEIKFIKMERINQLGIKTLSDLIKPGNLERLGKLLIKTFDEVLTGNLKTDYSQLNQRDRELFIQGHNSSYWLEIKPSDSTAPDYKKKYKRYDRRLKRFNELLELTGANQQKKEIRELLIQKVDELCNPRITGETDRDKLSEIRRIITPKTNEKKRGKLTAPKKNKTGENASLFYSDKKRHKTNLKIRKCLVTELDVSMQRDGSLFLSHTGLKYYYNTNKELFDSIKNKYLPKEWNNSDLKIQIEKLAHNIRCIYSNRRIKQKHIYPENQFRLFEIKSDELNTKKEMFLK